MVLETINNDIPFLGHHVIRSISHALTVNVMIRTSYRMISSAIWDLFFEIFIFRLFARARSASAK